MGYRKLIGFGDSSFVVSLPKDWINKHGLKKGDGLMLDVENDAIKIIADGGIRNSGDIIKSRIRNP